MFLRSPWSWLPYHLQPVKSIQGKILTNTKTKTNTNKSNTKQVFTCFNVTCWVLSVLEIDSCWDCNFWKSSIKWAPASWIRCSDWSRAITVGMAVIIPSSFDTVSNNESNCSPNTKIPDQMDRTLISFFLADLQRGERSQPFSQIARFGEYFSFDS